ncbi:O52B2 protein, partial [Corythaeola cristata]|nr:O52B2 protein [Corythaeola cristata]
PCFILTRTNSSQNRTLSFFLGDFPAWETTRMWFAIPLCLTYLLTLLGNLAVLSIIRAEQSLHASMYLVLAMLAVADLGLSTSTFPTMLRVLWLEAREIRFDTCLAQMFFIHSFADIESAVILAMAFDRYVAICHPLRYSSILTNSVTTKISKIGLAAKARSFCMMFPTIFLLPRLPYCGHSVMPHTCCEHMGIAQLACADISVNIWYGFATTLLSPGLDIVLIGVSYVLILRAVFRLLSKDAQLKAAGTCSSHACVILMFYTPPFFSFFTHQFGHNVPHHAHILLANLYVLLPPMLNPIVYTMKNKLIREKVSQVLFRTGR